MYERERLVSTVGGWTVTLFLFSGFQEKFRSRFASWHHFCCILKLLLSTMVSRSIRPSMLRRLLQRQSVKGSLILRPGSTISRSFSSSNEVNLTEQEKIFQSKGLLDEQGFTIFDTLHEMQVRSCEVYAENELFGTYSPESKLFEWMTFNEYGTSVDQCRAVLKDLGKLRGYERQKGTFQSMHSYFVFYPLCYFRCHGVQ